MEGEEREEPLYGGTQLLLPWDVRASLAMTVPLGKQIRIAGLQPTWSSEVELWNRGAADFSNLVVD